MPTIRHIIDHARRRSRRSQRIKVTCLWKADVQAVTVRTATNVTFAKWSDVMRVVSELIETPSSDGAGGRAQDDRDAGVNVKRVRLVGWSRGGSIALRVAIAHPHRVECVALLAASSPPPSSDLAHVRCPVRIWHARHDDVVPFATAQRIHARVTNSTLFTSDSTRGDEHGCDAFAVPCAGWTCRARVDMLEDRLQRVRKRVRVVKKTPHRVAL